MTSTTAQQDKSGIRGAMPTRLHHFAYTTYDMETTRRFYEDVIGMPLAQTWIETRDTPDGGTSAYVHCFYGLADGGALAFFEYEGREPVTYSDPQPSFHIALRCDEATQAGIRDRLTGAGYSARVTDHGYCVSLYVTDPNGLMLEFTVDHEDIDAIVARQAAAAHEELERWRSGDHRPNNTLRPH